MSCGLRSFPSTYGRSDKRETSVHYRPSSSGRMNLSGISPEDLDKAVQQIDAYSMDVVLQNFRRSFGLTTPFFQSLSLDPPATMEELYRRADKYSTLEDNILVASQTVMITAQNSKPTTKGQPEQKESQSKNQKRS